MPIPVTNNISNKSNTAIAAVRIGTTPFVLALSGIPLSLALGAVVGPGELKLKPLLGERDSMSEEFCCIVDIDDMHVVGQLFHWYRVLCMWMREVDKHTCSLM